MTDWGALGPKDQAKVTKLFQLIDFDKDGIISYPEVRAANGGDPDGTMQKMFKKLDKNKDGQASMDEWIKFWVALHKAKGDKPFGKFIKALASAAMANNPPAPKEVAGQSAELSPEAVGLASELFGLLDLDANGGVSVDEFTVAHGSSGGMWSVLDHNQDGVLSLREVLSVLGVMQTKKGHDCVVYYIKHMMSVIRDNQIDNPKAKGVSLAGKCSHVYHNRTSKIRALGDTIKTVNSAMVDALEQNRAAELLANEEALVSTRGPELLMLACWKGDTAAVDELLMAGVDPNACDTDGFTALMYAILADQTGSMKALYKGDTDGKLDLCFQDKTGATALMVAACEGNMTAGGAIMAWAGKDGPKLANFVDNNTTTALMLSAQNGHATFVAFLLSPQYKIDVAAKNKDGLDAMELAEQGGHTQVAVMMQEER